MVIYIKYTNRHYLEKNESERTDKLVIMTHESIITMIPFLFLLLPCVN